MAFASLAAALGLWCLPTTLAKPPKPPGGGGGGLVNPGWVFVDSASISTLKLLSSDGLNAQEIVRGKAYRPIRAPAWSSDGNWIAYANYEDGGTSIHVVHPDGSGQKVICSFVTGDGRAPDGNLALQWVPGEVDRILYAGYDTNLYVLRTIGANPSPQLLLSATASGATLSPDMDSAPGYQGALAYVNGWYTAENRGLMIVVPVVDGASGLEVVSELAAVASSLVEGVELPAWSNDGLEIAFLYHNPGFGNSLEVLPVLVTPAGITLFESDVRTLYDSGIVTDYGPYHQLYDRPTWAPGNSWIAFVAQVGGEPSGTKAFDLFRVRPDGLSPAVNVTNGTRRPRFADWNPRWNNDIDNP
jgi:Tol biopolymer transport system component